MSTTTEQHIEVWHDQASDSENPVWCVSLCEADGEEIRCLCTRKNHSAATSAGQSAAKKRGMVVVERS